MRIQRWNGKFFCWLVALLNPFAGVLVSLFLSAGRVKISYFSLSLSFALMYMYFPLLWDVKNNFYRVVFRPEDGLNLYTGALYILVSHLDLSFFGALFLLTLILMFMLAFLFERHLDEIMKNRPYPYFLICLFLYISLFEYRNTVDLQKTTLALIVFICSLRVEGGVKRSALFLLSAAIHPLTLILILCNICAGRVSSRGFYLLAVVFSVFVSLIWSEVLVSFVARYQPFLPERVATYLLSEPSRFSSEGVANFVKYLRLMSILAVSYVFLKYADFSIGGANKKNARLIVVLCAVAVLFGFNEVFLERLHLAVTAVAIYFAISFRIDRRHLYLIAFFILLNTFIHGSYALKVVFSQEHYEVIQNQEEKINVFERALYYPTFLLVWFDRFGYSDEFISINAR